MFTLVISSSALSSFERTILKLSLEKIIKDIIIEYVFKVW